MIEKNKEFISPFPEFSKEDSPIPFSQPQLTPEQKVLLRRDIFLPVSAIVQDVEASDAGSYGNFFVSDRDWRIISISEVHRVVATGGSIQVEKIPSGTAKDSGTDLLTTAFDLTASANVPRFGILIGTASSLILQRGERLGLVISGLSGTPEDICITVLLQAN